MLNELKENTATWLKEIRKMVHEQNKNISQETETLKNKWDYKK